MSEPLALLAGLGLAALLCVAAWPEDAGGAVSATLVVSVLLLATQAASTPRSAAVLFVLVCCLLTAEALSLARPVVPSIPVLMTTLLVNALSPLVVRLHRPLRRLSLLVLALAAGGMATHFVF